MSAATAAAGPPTTPDDPWSAVVRIGGVDYPVRIPDVCRPGSLLTDEAEYPEAVVPAMLAHLAADLVAPADADRTRAVWSALITLVSDQRTRLEITERIGRTGDPLGVEGLRAGMIEAVKALARVVPRPAPTGREPCTLVNIAGVTYTATVPAGLAGLPARAAAAARGVRVAVGPPALGLLLFDEATLCALNDRVADPLDPCTGDDITAAVAAALDRLAVYSARSVEAEVDMTLGEVDFAERESPVMAEVGGVAYPLAYPRVWPRFVELVASMGPLIHPAERVERGVQLEALGGLVAAAVPMVFSPADAATIAGLISLERLEVAEVGMSLMLALVALDGAMRGGVEAAAAALDAVEESAR